MAETRFNEAAGRVLDFDRIAPGGVDVDGGDAAATAEEIIKRHPGELALDVPEGHVGTGDRVVEHGAAAPIAADGEHRPDVCDVVHGAADDLGFHVLLDRGGDRERALGKGGAPQPNEVRLVRLDFHHDQPDALRRGQDDAHVADTWSPVA